MKKYTRNTILYSALTVSLVVSYWVVRQDAKPLEASNSAMIEINEQASDGYETGSSSGEILVSQLRQ